MVFHGLFTGQWRNQILSPVTTGTTNTTGEHPETSASSASLSPAGCTGVLEHGKDMESSEKKSSNTSKKDQGVNETCRE